MAEIKYNILKQIINEGRLEDTIKKYSDKLPEPVIRELSKADPSGNNKYLDWMVRVVSQAPSNKSDIIKNVKCFHDNVNRLSDKHIKAIYSEDMWENPTTEHKDIINRIIKTPKDINSYASHLWIKPMCDYFEEQKPKNTSRVKIYEDDRWLLVAPLTHQASCSYGAHSNWCVSTSNTNYFNDYMKRGLLIFFIDKKGSNTRKPSANVYKFAVYITYESPDLDSWSWWSMEDSNIDARLMMNLVPRHLLKEGEKYVAEVIKTIEKESAVNEEEIKENSVFSIKYNRNIVTLPKYESWSPESLNSVTEYLFKYNNNNVLQLDRYKASGLPIVNIIINPGNFPYINISAFSWNPALSSRRPDNTILRSDVIIKLNDRWGGYSEYISKMSAEEKEDFYNMYIKMFNEADIVNNITIRTSELVVGDTIVFRPQGRRWGTGQNLTVSRVAEKSLLLSNGKRISRSTNSYKEKVTGVAKIIDDNQVSESKWIRKRII